MKSRLIPKPFVVVLLWGIAATSVPSEAAENVARTLQEALKERGFYTAAPSGVMDEQTRAALKRFQIREGLTVTGEPDAATLQALGNGPPSGVAAARDNVPARERAQQMVTSDRDFLERVEAMEAQGTPAARAPVESTRLPPVAAPPEPAAVERRTEPLRREESPAQPAAEPPGAVSDDAVIRFVQSYLDAAEAPSPESEVAHYAKEVDYFDSGKVSRDFVRKDQARYYQRWPTREFKLLGEPQVDRRSPDGATVRFRVAYALRGKGENARGQTENVVRLRREGSSLRIAAIRERKLD